MSSLTTRSPNSACSTLAVQFDRRSDTHCFDAGYSLQADTTNSRCDESRPANRPAFGAPLFNQMSRVPLNHGNVRYFVRTQNRNCETDFRRSHLGPDARARMYEAVVAYARIRLSGIAIHFPCNWSMPSAEKRSPGLIKCPANIYLSIVCLLTRFCLSNTAWIVCKNSCCFSAISWQCI